MNDDGTYRYMRGTAHSPPLAAISFTSRPILELALVKIAADG